MESLTLQRSTILGTVLGKAVHCSLRGSPAGLQLAAGNYLLRPAQNSPVYGLVMPIEPFTAATEAAVARQFNDPSAVKFSEPSAVKFTDTSAVKFRDPSAVKYTDPAAVKYTDPSAVKFTDPSAVKFRDPSAVKYMDPSAVKFTDPSTVKSMPPSQNAPAVKFDTAAAPAVKFDAAAAPAVKFDTAAGQVTQPVLISERSIAGNSFQATAGFGDLVDVVQRAGAVKLVVV